MGKRSQRSHSGCLTCRIRKVKCDRGQPACQQCLRTSRTCEGPSLAIRFVYPKATASIAAVPRNTPFTDSIDGRSLSYYVHYAGPTLSGGLDGDLWNDLIPQLTHTSTIVRLAVLSISILYEYPLSSGSGSVFTSNHRRAMKWYSQALLAAHTSTDLEVQLVACILFLTIEIQQLNLSNTQRLLYTGYGLLAQYIALKSLPHATPPPVWMTQTVYPVFLRQRALLSSTDSVSLPNWDMVLPHLLSPPNAPMHTLSDARTQIAILLYDIALLPPPTSTCAARTNLYSRLETWHKNITHLFVTTNLEHYTRHALLSHYHIARICLITGLSPFPPSPQHLHTSDPTMFEPMLDHVVLALDNNPHTCPSSTSSTAQQGSISRDGRHRIPFTLDLSLIPALHFAGENCTDPAIRERVVELLERGPRQEGLFEADAQVRKVRAWSRGFGKGDIGFDGRAVRRENQDGEIVQ